jgi:hypothetical protein
VTEIYPEKMEANSEEMKSVVEHEEVPKEEAVVKPVSALKKWHGDWNLAAGHCQKLKERNQGNVGSWKMLAAACRGMTCHALSAWHKGHCCLG